jgi:two-component system nitrate/nitrite sensor histidine kinase NarX
MPGGGAGRCKSALTYGNPPPPSPHLKNRAADVMVTAPAAPAAPLAPALLAELAADVAAGRDLRELLDHFLAPIIELAQARAGAVRILATHGTQLELVGSVGLPPDLVEAERVVTRVCGFCGQSANEHRIAWAGDLHDCKLRTGHAFFGDGCSRALAIPLECKGRLLGIYNLFFDHGEMPGPAVLSLLRTVGELLALALENRRLEAENLRASISRERQMMAAEVHDAVAQNLTFIKMRLPLLRDAVEAGDVERALAYVEDVRETLGEAHGSLREIVTHFRTRVDPRGLARAFELLAAHFRTRTGIELQVDNRFPQLELGDAARADLFHIVQEALANVERHSRARHAWVSLAPGLGQVELRIDDDGIGATAPGAGEPAHWGIDIMRERAHRLGGELVVAPREGGGTSVRFAFPLPAGEAP